MAFLAVIICIVGNGLFATTAFEGKAVVRLMFRDIFAKKERDLVYLDESTIGAVVLAVLTASITLLVLLVNILHSSAVARRMFGAFFMTSYPLVLVSYREILCAVCQYNNKISAHITSSSSPIPAWY